MGTEFVKNDEIPIASGGKAEVLERLGSGGQGTVYRVRYNKNEYALKWYHKGAIASPDQFMENLRKNITDGPPGKAFLWPKFLTEKTQDSFGYLMDLKPKDFCNFSDLLNKRDCNGNKIEFAGLATAVCCALNMVNNFGALHRQGKSYQDLNDGNFFINCKTGDVLIADNDNVAPDRDNLGIGGKPGYMAPEIVRGEARPDTLTDLHSLAVVLFKLFLRHDPLMGKKSVEGVCLTEEAEKKLYGDDPIFIFDPVNKANEPVPGIHHNPIKLWPYYPEYIRDAFVRSFSQGMGDPNKRVTEHEWKKLFVRFRGEIWSCVSCSGEILAHQTQVQNGVFSCGKCKTSLSSPCKITLNGYTVHLFPHNKLYKCHTTQVGHDAASVTGEVLRSKSTGMWGLKNLSGANWTASSAGGGNRVIKDGEVLPIAEGITIDFAGVCGIITK